MTANPSRYVESPPPPELAPRVACVWSQSIGGSTVHHHRVLPDGCVDIVWIGEPDPVIVGPSTGPVVVALSGGQELVGVRFRAGWAAVSLGMPLDEIVGVEVPLRDVWGDCAALLTERVRKAASPRARRAALASALVDGLRGRADADPLTRFSVDWLQRHPNKRIQELARHVGLSSRQLHRRMVPSLGYSPKLFQRIMRMQRWLASTRGAAIATTTLADLACATGYADEAHLCRDVRELAGATPRQILQSRTSVSDS